MAINFLLFVLMHLIISCLQQTSVQAKWVKSVCSYYCLAFLTESFCNTYGMNLTEFGKRLQTKPHMKNTFLLWATWPLTHAVPAPYRVLVILGTTTRYTFIFPLILQLQVHNLIVCKAHHIGGKRNTMVCKFFNFWSNKKNKWEDIKLDLMYRWMNTLGVYL